MERLSLPTLSVVIPTAGRPTLRRTLDSMAPQMLPGDECICVGDVLDGPLRVTEEIVKEYPWCRYIEHAGAAHDWGHSQFMVGQEAATGDWLLGNDDDDVFTPDAFATIRGVISTLDQLRPLLFRFRAQWGMTYWLMPGLVQQGAIGGHCLVQPRIPAKMGQRTSRYEADYDWITSTLANWEPIAPLWVDRVIAIARPGEGE